MKDYIQKLIQAFTTSTTNEEMDKKVHQWLLDEEHRDEKEEAMHTLWNTTTGQADAGTWRSLSAVYKKLGIDRKAKKNIRFTLWRYAAVAVVLLAVSISGTFFFTKERYSTGGMVEAFTPAGEMKQVLLPDGSSVQTNSGTILFYPEAFKGDTRTVYLIGEANFKVKKNPEKPFIVKSADLSVTALGTEFNVSAYPDDNELVATLIHGKIKVDCHEGGKAYVLHPGQQVTYLRNSTASSVAEANLEDVTAWQKGLFVFRSATMKDILSTLERRYDVTFQYNASHFNEDKYNFRFPEKTNIAEIMSIVQEVVGGFNYRLEEDVCYIKVKKLK